MKKKNLLVTGGTGFIGRALCRKLLEEGTLLTVLSRDPARVTGLFGSAVRGVASLDSLVASTPFDAVVNLAGEPIADRRWTAGRKRILEESRIDLTGSLISCMEKWDRKPECLISGSAVGFYGDQGDRETVENTPPHDEYTHRLCRDWEAEALKAEGLGVRVCLLRTGLVVGPGGGFLQKMLPPFRLGLGGRLGSGRQWMPWICLDDLVNLICFLIGNRELSGPFNGTAPTPVTNAEFTARLASALKRPAILPVPGIALRIGLGEMSRLLLTGQKAIPSAALAAGFRFRCTGLDEALQKALSLPGRY